jgi:hypothetical protein
MILVTIAPQPCQKVSREQESALLPLGFTGMITRERASDVHILAALPPSPVGDEERFSPWSLPARTAGSPHA